MMSLLSVMICTRQGVFRAFRPAITACNSIRLHVVSAMLPEISFSWCSPCTITLSSAAHPPSPCAQAPSVKIRTVCMASGHTCPFPPTGMGTRKTDPKTRNPGEGVTTKGRAEYFSLFAGVVPAGPSWQLFWALPPAPVGQVAILMKPVPLLDPSGGCPAPYSRGSELARRCPHWCLFPRCVRGRRMMRLCLVLEGVTVSTSVTRPIP